MDIRSYRSTLDDDEHYDVKLSRMEVASFSSHIELRVIELVAKDLAAQFLAAHGSEVLGRLNAEAIATMALAEAGAAVNETLHKKMPDRILEIEKRVASEPVILQRGIFGGVKRL